MSTWYEVDKDDIDFSNDKKDMHILYYHDNGGSYYVSVPVEMIKEKLAELKEGKHGI